jgi:type I restriction enzyme S subunit
LVIHAMDAFAGAIGVSEDDGKCTPVYSVCVPIGEDISSPYYAAVLRHMALSGYVNALAKGIRERSTEFRWSDAGEVALPVPPASEQAAIVAFLDHETGKIDALVEEQRRLIELLKEKRQAVISHAVTKGLDPDAKMKPSGVQWLGDVPEHWQVKPLKYMVSHVVDCLHTTPTYDGELLYPAIRTADVERGVLLLDQARLVSEEIYLERIQRLRPEAGDVVYSREGERFGMAALVPQGVNLCLGQRMMMFRAMSPNSPGFLMWALNSEPIYQEVLARTAGAMAPHANISDVINFRIPCPGGEEQREIAAEIAKTTKQIDDLVSKSEKAITLLGERRAALVSSAVTGKINLSVATGAQQIDAGRFRLTVGAEIVERLAHKKAFGRVKLQKLLYLAEAEADIPELKGEYLREAAGPLDRDLIAEVEARLQGHVAVEQSGGPGSPVTYRVLGAKGTHREELAALLGSRTENLDRLVELLGDMDTLQVEAVTTLYAVWNDAVLDGHQPSDVEIVRGVLEDWHPEKARKFRAAELTVWLGWMKRNHLVPRGAGPRTVTGRLFA